MPDEIDLSGWARLHVSVKDASATGGGEVSRRLDGGLYMRKLCPQCGGQGCALCNEGFIWISVYAPGGGEQGATSDNERSWENDPRDGCP